MHNPYDHLVDAAVDELIQVDPAVFARRCQSDRFMHVESLLARLIDSAVDDRWHHNQRRRGDPDIDRFTLLPVTVTMAFAG